MKAHHIKAHSITNYTTIEIGGLWYRASSNKKSYWTDKAYSTKEEAKEEILIIMLQEAQYRMDNIIHQLGDYGWGEGYDGDKDIGNLLA